MSQRLILPINKTKLTASMKTTAYKTRFGVEHYGVDMVSAEGNLTLWASGEGTVVAAGKDSVVGNVVAVLYPGAVNHHTGKESNIIFRYYHLKEIMVQTGQTVDKDTTLGTYGNTGSLSTGAHLHLEADTDTAHPLYSPTVLRSSFLQGRAAGANDKTMSNPLDWLHRKSDKPDNQTFTTANDAYIIQEDKIIPEITGMLITSDVRTMGIDVSSHNGEIDFAKVKAAGKEFIFIRIGWAGWDGAIEANGGIDKRFHENMKAAIAAGLHVGVYLYSYCKTPDAARIAARETLALVKPYTLTYPIAFDIEDTSDSGTRYDKMSRAENSEIVGAFLTTIQRAGYFGMLYTYTSFAQNYLDMAALAEWDVWIAQYAKSVTYQGEYGIWQYNGDVPGFIGSCAGVVGACDLNVAHKDYAALISAAGLNVPESQSQDGAELDRLRKEKAAWQQEEINLHARISALETKLREIHDLSA